MDTTTKDQQPAPEVTFPFWKTIWEYARPYRGKVIFASVCSLVVGGAVALQPMMIKFVVDQGINRPDSSARTRMLWALLFSGLYILLSGSRISIWMLGFRRLIRFVEGFLFEVRSRFFRHVQGLCYRFHDQVSSGELFNYMMGSPVNHLKMFLRQFTMTVPYQIVSWVVSLAVLVTFDIGMSVILLATVVAIVLVNRRSRRRMRAITSDFMREESTVSKYVADMLRGCREIKIHAIENEVSNSFDHQIDRIRTFGELLSIRQNIEGVKPEGIRYAGVAVVYIAGAWSCIYRDLSVGTLFAFVNSMGLLLQPLIMLTQLNLIKANAEAGLERILRVLQTETSVNEKPHDLRVAIAEQEDRARERGLPLVEFRNVSFAYSGNPVLRNVSCTIPHDQSVALVGPSGSGKSTFVRLILRLYDIQEGNIYVNGREIGDFSLQELRSSFGVVSQDTFLFQTNLLENVRVAYPDAPEEEVHRAMIMAYVTEFVNELPKGVMTDVGENGYSLSGGQRQRIAIARAILGNPHYYIFDEATSSLDNQSEKRIQQAMTDLGTRHTLIIIAHRLSTIRNVDKILVFDKGRIVQEGTYDRLAEEEGLFRTLLKHGMED